MSNNILKGTWSFCKRCKETITEDDDLAEVVPKDRQEFMSRMARVIIIHAECMIRGDEIV